MAQHGGEQALVHTIDLGPYFDGLRRSQLELARQVDDACSATGFLVVTGHRIDPNLIDDVYAVTKAFFHLSLDRKLASAPPAPDVFRGYRAPQSAALARSLDVDTPPDLVESFVINAVVNGPAPQVLPDGYERFYHPNIWPTEPANFRTIWEAYYRAMTGLATDLMRLFALALGLDEHWFDAIIDQPRANLLANYYPPQPEPPEPGQLRRGPHTDYGSLTILYQDDAPGGLQVQDPQDPRGAWHDVPFVPGAFVINLGDLMARWTNDRWVSTMHRVVNPSRADAATERLTIPYFHLPNLEAPIESIPTCVDADRPAKYEPVQTGAWFLGKHLKTVERVKP